MPHNNHSGANKKRDMNGGHDLPPNPPKKPTPNPPPNDGMNGQNDEDVGKDHQKDDINEDDDEMLKLSLSSYYNQQNNPPPLPVPARAPRVRRKPSKSPGEGKSEIIPAPYPWATARRAFVHSLAHLTANDITSITGDVQCKKCEKTFTLGFDLLQKFLEVGTFVAKKKEEMHQRAPKEWCNPALPGCGYCGEGNCARPVVAAKKRNINWLFLLLGQMLGCCTLDQLKYFCKHTKNHRTGAKDRVLYLAYVSLCKQLDPDGPFDK